jgi:subtilisin family serine protease
MMRLTRPLLMMLGMAVVGCQTPVVDLQLTGVNHPPAASPIAGDANATSSQRPLTQGTGPQATAPLAGAINLPTPGAHADLTRQPTWPAPEATVATKTSTFPAVGNPVRPAVVLLPRPNAAPVGPRISPDTIIVTLETDAVEAAVLANPAFQGFERLDEFALGNERVLSLHLPAGLGVTAAIARISSVTGVARANENVVRRRTGFAFTRVDPRYGEQWAHRPDRSNTEAAWSVVPAASQSKVIAAVLDSGLDVSHPEFAGRIQGAMNFAGAGAIPDTNVKDDVGHGTHVTGILAAAGDNGVGVAGVAWGVQILPVKVLDKDGNGNDFQILKGFAYATQYVPKPDNGARVRVINLSLGSDGGRVSQLWTDAVAAANAAGIVVVAASGNDGRDVVGLPANTPGVLAVGSTGNYVAWENISPFSNYGARLDLTAPGEGILSTTPVLGSELGAMYAYASGTSMASPFVAGVAALVMARYDPANAQTNASFAARVRQRLMRAVDDLGPPGHDPLYGTGRINAAKAVAPATLDQLP